MSRYYLSRLDLDDRLTHVGVWDQINQREVWSTDCGGWAWDPPCGGCDRCIFDQVCYCFEREKAKAFMLQRAGFEVADPAVIDMRKLYDLSGGYHLGGSHTGQDCWMRGERQ